MRRRTLLKAGAAGVPASLCVLVAAAPGEAAAAPTVSRVLARHLQVPWGVAFLPNGNALVGDRDSGRVHEVSRRGGSTLVGRVRVNSQRQEHGEGGLLGLALSPRYATDGWLYAYITTASDNRIIRMRHGSGLGRPQVVLAGIPMALHHNGGRLAFGPDGMLYASTGDASDSGLAQRRSSLAGKILRLTPDGDVPRGNPFGSPVWSYGHRNVEGLAFDGRGRLWATELGADDLDELNLIRRGLNYGWPRTEGPDGPGGFHDPVTTWSTSRCSPSGVAILGGRAYVGALRGRSLYSVRLNGPRRGRKVRFLVGTYGRIRTVQRAPDGSLWVTTSNRDGRNPAAPPDDRVLRVVVR